MKHATWTQYWVKRITLVVLAFMIVACGGGKDDSEMVLAAKDYLAQNQIREAALELKNALQSNPENAEARFILGQINLDVGDTAAAEKEFRRALQAGWPENEVMLGLARALNNSNAYQRTLDEITIKESYPSMSLANLHGVRAIAHAGLGELDLANDTLSKGTSINPDALYILKAGIQLQLAAENYEAANAALIKALKKYPENQELLLLAAVIEQQNNQKNKALDAYRQIIEQEPPGLITVYGRKARLELARLNITDKNLGLAESMLAPLLKQNANDPLVNYMGALLAYEQGNMNLAEERLLNVLKVAPDHIQTQLLYGTVNYAQQDYEQAAYYLGKYVLDAPDNLTARKLLGRTYIMLGQHKEAQEVLQSGLKYSAEDSELLALVGLSNIQSGNIIAGIEELEKAVKAAPDSVSLRSELAKAYISIGQTENAYQLLNAILAEGDDRQQTEALLVYTYLRSGRLEKAVDTVLDMLEKEPKNPAILTLAGSVFVAADDKVEARKRLSKALVIDPGFVSATMALARLEELEGNEETAEELYRRIAGSESKSIEPMMALARMAEAQNETQDMLGWLEKAREKAPDDARPRISLAEYYLRQKQPEKADFYINEAIKVAPGDNILLAMQGRVLMAQKRYNEALSPLNELVSRVPGSALARVLLGETYLKLGQTSQARTQLELSLEKQPYSISAMALLATVEIKSGNEERALRYADQIQKIEPDLSMGYEIAGDAFIARNENIEAIAAYTLAWERNKSAELAIKLSEVHARSGQPEQASTYLQAWLSDNPDDGRVLEFLGAAYQNAGQDNKAIEAYENVLALQPENVVALNNLAWLYSKLNNQKALELAEKAHMLKPDDSGIMDTYGWILVQQGQVDKGRLILEKVIAQLPEVPEVQYHYAVALLESGEKIAARKILHKLLDEGRAFEGRKEAEMLLK